MNDFCITCAAGITYTNLENLLYDMDNKADSFTQENIKYLNNYIWEVIEETKGRIPCGMLGIIDEIDFIYNYMADTIILDYDLYKGWSNKLIILFSPISKKYYGIYAAEGRYIDIEYSELLVQVKPIEKVMLTWEEVKEE